jgi:hypothetical protein
MNKLSGVAGAGIGLALGSGLFFSPAEAHEVKNKPMPEVVRSSCFSRLGQYAIIGLPGPICFGQAIETSDKQVTIGPADPNTNNQNSETGATAGDYGRELLFLAGVLTAVTGVGVSIRNDRRRATQDAGIARDYEEMRYAKPVEVDAEWIIYLASHANEQ